MLVTEWLEAEMNFACAFGRIEAGYGSELGLRGQLERWDNGGQFSSRNFEVSIDLLPGVKCGGFGSAEEKHMCK